MVKTNRGLIKYLFLTLITFGIYPLFFWWGYCKDLNTVCGNVGSKSPNYIVVLLLSCITCGIYYLVWVYSQSERLRDAGKNYGVYVKHGGLSMLMWTIFGSCILIGPFIVMYRQCKYMNMVATAYNAAQKA